MSCPVVEAGETCGKPVKTRGWCTRHYTRWLRHGDPLAVELVMPDRKPAQFGLPPITDAEREWTELAACQNVAAPITNAAVLKFCARCPVTRQCGELGVYLGEPARGIVWGGNVL